MAKRELLESLFRRHGLEDFRWVNPQKIVVAEWVRMKCMYGCDQYGKAACCPPNTPSVETCTRFFREYSEAAVFHFVKQVAGTDDRYAWNREVHKKLLGIERAAFLSGFPKAFCLFTGSCANCPECVQTRLDCRNLDLSRPTPEAMAVDVFATVKEVDYPLAVLTNYDQQMNRYAFLMIE
jgi:predicted metal-binding protein